jgi:hypothetical protein
MRDGSRGVRPAPAAVIGPLARSRQPTERNNPGWVRSGDSCSGKKVTVARLRLVGGLRHSPRRECNHLGSSWHTVWRNISQSSLVQEPATCWRIQIGRPGTSARLRFGRTEVHGLLISMEQLVSCSCTGSPARWWGTVPPRRRRAASLQPSRSVLVFTRSVVAIVGTGAHASDSARRDNDVKRDNPAWRASYCSRSLPTAGLLRRNAGHWVCRRGVQLSTCDQGCGARLAKRGPSDGGYHQNSVRKKRSTRSMRMPPIRRRP